jgi:hypothetical protein
MKRSSRPPDEFDPYGHGKALYFYSLLVAKTETKGLREHFVVPPIRYRDIGLSGLVSGAAKMRPSRSISAMVCSAFIDGRVLPMAQQEPP